jgi:hypothetical protein
MHQTGGFSHLKKVHTKGGKESLGVSLLTLTSSLSILFLFLASEPTTCFFFQFDMTTNTTAAAAAFAEMVDVKTKIAPSAPPPPSAAVGGHDGARPPAMVSVDDAKVPWLADDGEGMEGSCLKPALHLSPATQFDASKPPPGILKLKDNEDLFTALTQLNLMYSAENGTSCCGRIVEDGKIGVIETQGRISFVKPGQWMLWNRRSQWSEPADHFMTAPIIRAKGITIVTLNQRQAVIVQDAAGKSMILFGSGRYIITAPAGIFSAEVISLVDLPEHYHGNRFDFFNVPQGKVAGITMSNGQIRILLPGVHVVEDAKFERFLPTVPIQSKLKKEVVTSDLVTVSLEVDLTTMLVNCARFLKMSAQVSDAKSVGCKDLYDAIEESAISHFTDVFSKTQYYNFRTRQGEVESKFEETALEILDIEAQKYGGRVTKVNILKQRADAVEAVYAAHTARQIELEQKQQSQRRQYDIEEGDQKHKQQMTERDERGKLQQQTLAQERDLVSRQYALKLAFQESEAAQKKLDFEATALVQRQKLQAQAESEAAKIRAAGAAQEQASKILIVAEAESKAEQMRGNAAAEAAQRKAVEKARGEELQGTAIAKSEGAKALARVNAMKDMAAVLKDNPVLADLEKQRLHDEYAVAKLRAIVEAGGTVVPVEMLRLMDASDDRLIKRLENQQTLRIINAANTADPNSTYTSQKQQLLPIFSNPPPPLPSHLAKFITPKPSRGDQKEDS